MELKKWRNNEQLKKYPLINEHSAIVFVLWAQAVAWLTNIKQYEAAASCCQVVFLWEASYHTETIAITNLKLHYIKLIC